ncbi:MAG: hypothetical protein JWM02_552 [Frankiales bacterium]|nr:hypothetical protein [Frankiales bacterium]
MTVGVPALRRSRPSSGVACAAVLIVLAAWLLVPDRAELPRHVVSDTAFVLAPAYAAWCCWRADTRSWRVLSTAAAAWSLGSLLWGVQDVALGQLSPHPSWAEAGYLAFPLLAVWGLLTLPGLPSVATGRRRMAVDALAVAASLLLVAWLYLLGNLARADGVLDTFLAIAFPACDLLVAAVVVIVLNRVPLRSASGVAALAVAGVAISDAIYAVLADGAGYRIGGPFDVAWPVAFLALASAPTRAVLVARKDHSRLLPTVPAAVALLTLLASGELRHGLDLVLTCDLIVLLGALCARQVLLSRENAALHRSLEARLDDATTRSHRLAVTDPLTGLPNRDAFTEILEALVCDLVPGDALGLVVLDLDGFQQLNDAFGHATGDALLAGVADRLRDGLRGDQLLARLTGDEFAVVLPALRADIDIVGVATRLGDCLAEPLHVGDLEVVLSASAGVARTRSTVTTASELLRDADTALYAAKEAGGGQYRAFAPVMHTAVRSRMALESDLRRALRAQELFLHYQPVVDLASQRVAGLEALARWDHPSRGAVSPAEFVPAAERTGLVVDLERRVLDLACAQLATWRREHHSLTVAVNVSPRHLHEEDFIASVLGTLSRHRLPPAALVLEVTESLLLDDDHQVLGVLELLRTSGVGLALDDFGTGYSSLSRLARYPFDTLKIDRAFVMDLEGSASASPILTATLAMARGLGMSVVAEGVETDAQLSFLRQHGCHLAQGFLLSRPGLASDVEHTLGKGALPRQGSTAVPQ